MIEEKKDSAVKLMGVLLRMPPKPHSEMKLNKAPKPHKPKHKKRGRPPKDKASRAS
jgi:hypothetical protein